MLGLLLAGWLGVAQAADYRCQGLSIVPGSLGEKRVAAVRESAGATFGAVQVLEREVMPMLGDATFAGYVSDTSILGATTAPVFLDANGCPRQGTSAYQYDVNAVNLAVATKAGPVTLFYSSSALMSYAPAGNTWRVLLTGINAIGGVWFATFGPFIGAEDDVYALGDYAADYALNYDFVAGATLDGVVVEAGAGYVGSRGFYLTTRSRPAHLGARAVVTRGLSRLPLAQAGLERLPVGGMLSSAFARRVDPSNDALDGVPLLQRPALYTGHLVQEAIADVVDVAAAAEVGPRPGLYQLRVAGHAPIDADEATPDDAPGFWVGTIRAPDQVQYGIPGGYRIQAGVRAAVAAEDAGLGRLAVLISLNDDDIIAVFPYSRNSVLVKVEGRFAGGAE